MEAIFIFMLHCSLC